MNACACSNTDMNACAHPSTDMNAYARSTTDVNACARSNTDVNACARSNTDADAHHGSTEVQPVNTSQSVSATRGCTHGLAHSYVPAFVQG